MISSFNNLYCLFGNMKYNIFVLFVTPRTKACAIILTDSGFVNGRMDL